jgi:hypothetical protein
MSSSYDNAINRILALELVLADLLECFEQLPAGYVVESAEGDLVNASEDLEDAINRANEVLNREEDVDE